MPSFLTNNKMNPALRARIERSLGQNPGRARLAPGAIAGLRVVTVSVIVGCIGWFVLHQRQQHDTLEGARQQLLTTLSSNAKSLAADSNELVPRLEAWLKESSGSYAGDVIAEPLRAEAGLAKLLKRPAIYVRGPIAALSDPKELGPAATESRKDPLLFCMLDPPASKDEKALLRNVRDAYKGGFDAPDANHVQRMYDALAGLPVLSDQWAERVMRAEDTASLKQLSQLVEKAPLEGAKLASQAELFIFALDEPKTDDSPSEFDGATRHLVRVHIVDLKSSEVLLRVRRLVDPAWISETARHRYARGLNGCKLALDVRDAALGNSALNAAP